MSEGDSPFQLWHFTNPMTAIHFTPAYSGWLEIRISMFAVAARLCSCRYNLQFMCVASTPPGWAAYFSLAINRQSIYWMAPEVFKQQTFRPFLKRLGRGSYPTSVFLHYLACFVVLRSYI
jgi:hypothetical protein